MKRTATITASTSISHNFKKIERSEGDQTREDEAKETLRKLLAIRPIHFIWAWFFLNTLPIV